jgi:Fe-S cluster assembly iron-binding protein IscA
MAMMLSLSACATKRTRETVKGETSRMVYVEETGDYCIVYDKYTKVMYAVSDGAYNQGTFTLLVDANGKPLLYNEP